MLALSALEEAISRVIEAGSEITSYAKKHESLDGDATRPSSGSKTHLVYSTELQSVRKSLANAAAYLYQISIDPKEYLEQLSANNQHLVCLRWLVNLDILRHIPEHGSISYIELATRAGVPEHQLKSVIRMAATHGFLFESNTSSVSHSSTSALIATDESFLNWARWLTNYSVPSAYRFSDATQKWGLTTEKNQTAFNIAMDVDLPFFGYLKSNAKMNSMFSSYMRNVASSEATSFKHLITGFDWASLAPGSTVVDVGGSGGHGSRALANAFTELRFIVQDLPDTIENAKAAQNGNAPDDRVKFMPHDFFTPQPVTDADIYLLRMIIHDWPDESAVMILSHLRNALKKPKARIVIMDTILPQPGTVSLLQERQLRVRDLTMMQVFNAKEREYETWKDLVEKVGLKILNVQQPEGSNMGLLEIGLANSSGSFLESEAPRSAILESADHSKPTLTNGTTTNGVIGVPVANVHTTLDEGIQNTTKDPLPVLIMGAGLSGLCIAQFLHKHSIPFAVYERDPAEDYRPQGYRLKLEADAAAALRESLSDVTYEAFEASCAESYIGETDFDPISGACIRSRAGGGLAGGLGLRATYTVDRSVFRRVMMNDIRDKIHFGREFTNFRIDEQGDQPHVTVTFKDGTTAIGRFLIGADGTRSRIRKQLIPHHKFLDTGAVCVYGKTIMTPELLQRYPAKALRWMTVCADTAPLIQSILIGDSPLTLLSEPIRFSPESRAKAAVAIPEDYVYWVLIGRKELFTDGSGISTQNNSPENIEPLNSEKAFNDESAKLSAAQSHALTGEWHPDLRSLFELQDIRQASTMRVVSAPPQIPTWEPSPWVTLVGDAVHAMSPCGGVGANTALRDAAELGKLFVATHNAPEPHQYHGKQSDADGNVGVQDDSRSFTSQVADFEGGLRKRAFGGIMRSFVGSKRMFDQRPFDQLTIVED